MAVIIKLGNIVIGASVMTVDEIRKAEAEGFVVERSKSVWVDSV